MQRRYQETPDDGMSDVTASDDISHIDFFVYRQPSLNLATGESTPRPFRIERT